MVHCITLLYIILCSCVYHLLYYTFPRVFIEFERPRSVDPLPTDAAQPVQEAVYVALKKSHERNKLFLYTKDDQSSRPSEKKSQFARENGIQRESEGAVMGGGSSSSGGGGVVRSIPSMELPDLGTQQIMITEV